MSANSPERILRLKSVLERTGLSRSTLYRKMQLGTFPKQLRISVRCAGWRESDIESWLRNPVVYSTAERQRNTRGSTKPQVYVPGSEWRATGGSMCTTSPI